MAGSGAVLGWLGTLWVLLSAPAAAAPQLNVCKNTLALPTAGFGLCTRGVHARDPQIPLWTAHSRAGPQCYQGDGSRGDVDRAVVGRRHFGICGQARKIAFDTCFCLSPAQPGLQAVEVPVVIPKLSGLCSVRPQASAEQQGGVLVWPQSPAAALG